MYDRLYSGDTMSMNICASMNKNMSIWSVHPSEGVTIAAFQREPPAGQKGECLFNKCWMNVMLI